MPRPRDRQSATGLLPRMEARTRKDGQITYRFHPLLADGTRGKPINLGTDKALAIRQVLDMASRASDQGTIGQLWRLYELSPDFTRLADGTKRQYRECWKQLAKVFEHGIAAGIRPADVARYLRVERATTARQDGDAAEFIQLQCGADGDNSNASNTGTLAGPASSSTGVSTGMVYVHDGDNWREEVSAS